MKDEADGLWADAVSCATEIMSSPATTGELESQEK